MQRQWGWQLLRSWLFLEGVIKDNFTSVTNISGFYDETKFLVGFALYGKVDSCLNSPFNINKNSSAIDGGLNGCKRWKVKFIVWTAFIFIFSKCGDVFSAEMKLDYSDGLISPGAVMPPEGAFILVKNGERICAIRFKNIFVEGEDKKPTPFRSGKRKVVADYEWYFGRFQAGRWVINPPEKNGYGRVWQGESYGVGRFALGGGNIHIVCNEFRLKWSPPANVYFYEFSFKDEGNEIAATPWKDYSSLDPNSNGLIWYEIDEKRKTFHIKN